MIKKLEKDFEQLNEAANQLEKETSIGARLSLLLTDNLLELIMYRHIFSEFENEHLYDRKVSLPDVERRQSLENFDKKVDHLKGEGIINDDTAGILKKVHDIRNEAYHSDVLRENVLIPIAKLHHKEICDLIPKLIDGNWYGNASKFLNKYGISENFATSKNLKQIVDQYTMLNGCEVDELAQSLSSDLISRISETIQNIIFLSNNTTQKGDPEDILKLYQFWEKGIYTSDHHDIEEFSTLYESFKPHVKLKTFNKWTARAKQILKEKNHYRVLEIWQEIDSQLLPIQTIIKYATYSFYAYIDEQVDAAKLDKFEDSLP